MKHFATLAIGTSALLGAAVTFALIRDLRAAAVGGLALGVVTGVPFVIARKRPQTFGFWTKTRLAWLNFAIAVLLVTCGIVGLQQSNPLGRFGAVLAVLAAVLTLALGVSWLRHRQPSE